ncbi:SigE family RNA polymerase sigma factor [Rugosimonospora africana]|uniref:DNA-directed RNA polymerase sigma-70 factor n=1 Tax=Rugosimonospora africana TaxID=556532 RepID=A0A8J3QRW1_9ACTN|nr:SigE family RNA polymerase sigma factor [Rugosimonospora africana]GIH14423.1 DNA-directed RNA polymerase sigma-70 factor [Rugosimonospora africana]
MSDDEFADFVSVRYAELLRTAYLLTGGQHTAEDLLQTVLLKAMRRWGRIDEPMAYLRRAMVNQSASRWRRIGRRSEFLTAAVPDRPATGDSAEDVAARDELLTALGTLPARMRAVLVLRYWEDLSEQETASALGCSVGSVKSQASRGLARLRSVLRPETEAHPRTTARLSAPVRAGATARPDMPAMRGRS